MANSKTAMFIQSAGTEPWKSIEELGQRETFASNPEIAESIFWYQGRFSKTSIVEFLASKYFENSYRIFWRGNKVENFIHVTRLRKLKNVGCISKLFNRLGRKRFLEINPKEENNILRLPVSGQFGATGLRVALSIEYFLKQTDANYMVRTNSTSYFNVEVLNTFISELPETRVYAGVALKLGEIPFMSGAVNIISRDVAENIMMLREHWNHEYPEDVALGKIIHDYDLADYLNIETIASESCEQIDFNNIESKPWIFHYRCKTGESEETIKIMKSIHNFLNT